MVLLEIRLLFGHSRVSIYFANLIICIVTSLFCELIYLLLAFLVGIPLFGGLEMPLTDFFMSIFNVFLIIVSFCSIFNFCNNAMN